MTERDSHPLPGESGDRAREQSRGAREHRRGGDHPDRESRTNSRGARLNVRGAEHSREEGDDDGQAGERAGGQRLGVAAQHAHGRHEAKRREGGDGKQQRHTGAQGQPSQGRFGLPGVDRHRGKESGEETGRDRQDRRCDGNTGDASGEAEQRRLDGVQKDDFARAHAKTLQDRDRVKPRPEPRTHRLCNTDPAEDQRDERDQAEEARGPLQSLPERGLGVGVGLHAHTGSRRDGGPQGLGGRLRVRGIGAVFQLDEDHAIDAAPECLEPRALEPGQREHHARPERERHVDFVGLS